MMSKLTLTRRAALGRAAAAIAVSAATQSTRGQDRNGGDGEGNQTFLRLLESSNQSVASLLKNGPPRQGRGVGRGANVAALVAAYCAPQSTHYKSEKLVPLMESATRVFVDAQNPDGTLDAGNLASPPDTGFVIEGLAASLTVLRAMSTSRHNSGLAEVDKVLSNKPSEEIRISGRTISLLLRR